MKTFTAVSLLTLLASTVSAQASNGCDENYTGTFEIAPYNITEYIPPQTETVCNTNPIVSLKNGVLTDQNHRTGEVVANHQFQFDDPIQGPTTSGFSICSNGSLAINGNAVFYGCTSGDFSNIYDIKVASQCHEVYLVTYPCSGSGASAPAVTAGASSTSSSSSSSTSTSSTSTSSTSTSSTTSSTPTTSTTSTTPISTPPTSTSSTTSIPLAPGPVVSVTSAPFPAGNATTSAATGTGVVTTSSSSTPSPSPTPSTFRGAASIVAVGGKLVAVVAGIAAFALI